MVKKLGELLEQHDVELEIVMLGDLELRPCRGCYNCQSHGELRCALRDDLLAIVERMKDVSGLMKTFMDRLSWAAHRPPFLGKPAMLVTTASSFTGSALKALEWFRFTGLDVVARVGWSVWPSPRVDWLRTSKDEHQRRRAASRFARAMRNPRRELSLAQVVQFYVGKTTPATDPDFFVADDAYHRELASLHPNVPRWKRWIGTLAYGSMQFLLQRRLGPRPARSTAARPPPNAPTG